VIEMGESKRRKAGTSTMKHDPPVKVEEITFTPDEEKQINHLVWGKLHASGPRFEKSLSLTKFSIQLGIFREEILVEVLRRLAAGEEGSPS
jgi:hypothetical protein